MPKRTNRAKRKACLRATGIDLHVCNQGVNRTKIFYDDDDYHNFHDSILRTVRDSGITVLLYVLTPTDFDLVVRQQHPYDISSFMKRVCEKHATDINLSRSRRGHLFKARYDITLVPNPGSLLILSQEIHSKPIKAGLVKHVLDWPYSSANDYAGLARSGLVTVEPLLELVGGRNAYMQFLKECESGKAGTVWKYLLRTSPT